MQQILTSEIGEKWIQPEIPKLPQVGDRIESLHRLSKGEKGTVTGIYQRSITYQPDGSESEIYLMNGQFSIIKEEKNCSNCKRSLAIKEGLYCFHKNAIVKPESHCKKFESKPPNLHLVSDTTPQPKSPSKTCGPCSECNSFDTSIPKDSLWQFCLSKGKYLSQDDLGGCEEFKPIVPYQSPSKKRRERGDGSGQIQLHYHKAKNGKSYEQYYYHYEIRENGMRQRKGSRYIPAAKLDLIREMEADKKPVVTILYELGLIV
jgi:hypothetical protein